MYYVYIHAYPKCMGGTVFYVGKGCKAKNGLDRIDAHEQEARRGVQSRKCDIIREIWNQGQEVIKEKVFEPSIEQDAFIYEWYLVNLIYGYENLTNICEGGDGGSVERSKLYRLVSLTLPTDLTHEIRKRDTYTGYLRTLLSFHLSSVEAVEELKRVSLPEHKRIPGIRADRYTMYLQLPLDIAFNLELFPVMSRSLIVEYLVRKDLLNLLTIK